MKIYTISTRYDSFYGGRKIRAYVKKYETLILGSERYEYIIEVLFADRWQYYKIKGGFKTKEEAKKAAELRMKYIENYGYEEEDEYV